MRGPSAALYGANASSGVLNLITKGRADTEGGLVRLTGGELATFNADLRWAAVTWAATWQAPRAACARAATSPSRASARRSTRRPCTATITTDCLPQERVPPRSRRTTTRSCSLRRALRPATSRRREPAHLRGRLRRRLGARPSRPASAASSSWTSSAAWRAPTSRPDALELPRRQPERSARRRSRRRSPPGINLALDEENWNVELQSQLVVRRRAFPRRRRRLLPRRRHRQLRRERAPTPARLPGRRRQSTRQTLMFEPVTTISRRSSRRSTGGSPSGSSWSSRPATTTHRLHDAEFSPKAGLVWQMTKPNYGLRLSYNEASRWRTTPSSSSRPKSGRRSTCGGPLLRAQHRDRSVRPLRDGAGGESRRVLRARRRPVLLRHRLPARRGGDRAAAGDGDHAGHPAPGRRIRRPRARGDRDHRARLQRRPRRPALPHRSTTTAARTRTSSPTCCRSSAPRSAASIRTSGRTQPPAELPDASAATSINFILQQVLGPTPPFLTNNFDGAPVLVLASYTNFGTVDTQGVDLGIDWVLTDTWTLELNGSWFDFEISGQPARGSTGCCCRTRRSTRARRRLTYVGWALRRHARLPLGRTTSAGWWGRSRATCLPTASSTRGRTS